MSRDTHYGAVRIITIRKAYDALRKAVRAHDPEAAEAALDRYEQWADFAFGADPFAHPLVRKRLEEIESGTARTEDTSEAARRVATAIESDMSAFNALIAGIGAHPEMPARHFFAQLLHDFADHLEATKDSPKPAPTCAAAEPQENSEP